MSAAAICIENDSKVCKSLQDPQLNLIIDIATNITVKQDTRKPTLRLLALLCDHAKANYTADHFHRLFLLLTDKILDVEEYNMFLVIISKLLGKCTYFFMLLILF